MHEISTAPLEDLTAPVIANRTSFRYTPYPEDFDRILNEMVKDDVNKKRYKVLEQTNNSYLIYYEFDAGSSERRSITYITHDGESFLVANFDVIQDYYNQFNEEIIENLKSIQIINENVKSNLIPANNANYDNGELLYHLNIL